MLKQAKMSWRTSEATESAAEGIFVDADMFPF